MPLESKDVIPTLKYTHNLYNTTMKCAQLMPDLSAQGAHIAFFEKTFKTVPMTQGLLKMGFGAYQIIYGETTEKQLLGSLSLTNGSLLFIFSILLLPSLPFLCAAVCGADFIVAIKELRNSYPNRTSNPEEYRKKCYNMVAAGTAFIGWILVVTPGLQVPGLIMITLSIGMNLCVNGREFTKSMRNIMNYCGELIAEAQSMIQPNITNNPSA